MHEQAYEWVRKHAADEKTVLDIGGRNINGSVRDLFPQAEYLSLDLYEGPGVDLVADAVTWTPDRKYDTVVCCEVFEHTSDWPAIVRTAYKALSKGGRLIATMAGPGRGAHSAIDGGPLQPSEYYMNVEPDDLEDVLKKCKFTEVTVDVMGADVRCIAWR